VNPTPTPTPTLKPTITPSDITAVLVTRGDIDLTPVLESLYTFHPVCEFGFYDVLVYDNSLNLDYKVFSRYLAAQLAHTEYIYVQDDDCIIDLAHYPWDQAGPSHVLCNMPQGHRKNYTGAVQLVGFGAVFSKALVKPTFEKYFRHFPQDGVLHAECDRFFTSQNKTVLVDVEVQHMPYATDASRMYRQADHTHRRTIIERRIEVVRQGDV
jgi:hypothetical protein